MLDTFRPLLEAARGLDLTDPDQACAELARRFDPQGPQAAALREQLLALLDEGKIAHKGELPVRFSRAAKPSPETDDHSIDVVLMTGPGPRHRHPQGEIDYCIALDGEPTFDGHGPGWVVYGPDSVHVPTVADGKMLIVYLLPGGGIEFLE